MYFLNDRHDMFEYSIYTRVGTACPYISGKYNTLEQVMIRIGEIERKHNHYGQLFYIDNDFYQNKYNINITGIYYKVLRRPVADWEEFTTNENCINICNYYKNQKVS